MKNLLVLFCVVLLSACGGSDSADPAPAGSPEVAAPADSAASASAEAAADEDEDEDAADEDEDAEDEEVDADADADAGKLTPADADADPDAEAAPAAPDDTKPTGATKPAPSAKPAPAPDLSCSEGSGCFVYFREQRCNFSEPIAIPARQRRNAGRLYPSSTADQPVSCKAPDMDDEAKARERWSADCVKGECVLIDSKPKGRGRR